MPAFGFKSQFVPLVERGEKTQTIRASRPRNGAYAYSIMQKALSCEWTYGDSGKEFEAGAQPTLSMQMVSADQIRMPPGAAVTPATQSTQTTPKRIAKPPLRLNRKGD